MIFTTVVWSMAASAGLTLGVIHFGVWLKNRAAAGYLLYTVTASAVAAMAFCELWMMRAETPQEFGGALRWFHVPAWVIVIALTGFVLFHLRAGRLWLAWTVCGLRTASLLIDFLQTPNINYREITRLRQVPFLGDSIAVAEGIPSAWTFLPELSLLTLAVFAFDASVTVWKRGDRRLALVTGGSIVLCVVAALVQSAFIVWHGSALPVMASLFFMMIVAAMSYETSRDMVLARRIATQLRDSEHALQQTERRFEQATEAAGVGIWEWDVARDEFWADERCRALFGLAPEQRIDFATFIAAVHPEDRDAVRSAVTQSLEKGGNFYDEYRVVLPTGGTRWIVTRGRVDSHATGKPSLRGVVLDVTRDKQLEEDLQRERGFLRMVLDMDPNLIFAKDRAGRFTLANKALADMYGTTVDALLGRTDADFNKNAREVNAFRRDDIYVLDTLRERVIAEENLTDAAGNVHCMQTVKRPLVGPDGTAQVLGTATDITARKLSEQVLRSSEALNRTVLASLEERVAIVDRQGMILAVNDAWNEFVAADGAPMSRIAAGTRVADLQMYGRAGAASEGTRASALRGINEVLAGTRDMFSMEYALDRPSGAAWYALRVLPLKRAEGGVVISHSDITQRKEAELELARQRTELAHYSRVTMLGQLSGSLAHELNQPLAAILSNAQAALRLLADDQCDLNEVHEILRDIVSDDKRAGEVIQGLRLLLKKGEMRRETLDLNELVRDVLRLMRSDIIHARIDLTLNLEPGLPTVSGDRVQLEQVLLNLIMNACDAMTGAAMTNPELVITTERRMGEGIRVSVIDQGMGIPPAELDRLFQPFYTTKAEGLGLGLAVSRRIMAAHGGRLWGENNADRGSRFCFTIAPSRGPASVRAGTGEAKGQ